MVQPMDGPRSLPEVGAPALCALKAAEVFDLDDVRTFGLDRIATLYGVGPKALRILREVLDD
jgi:hypothetical protein